MVIMRISSEVAVVIPVYNEEKVIKSVVDSVLKHYDFVVCVNDGSADGSSYEISKTKAHLVEHAINLGQGAALQTGLDYALQFNSVKYFVTFDADGQHRISDVASMLMALKKNKLDIVLGSRFLGEVKNITRSKKFFLRLAVRFTNAFSRVNLTDTHNGLRVFNRRFAKELHITMSDYAHASEIIDKIGRSRYSYAEVPITVDYTQYSLKKGQSIFNSVNILFDLLFSRAGRK